MTPEMIAILAVGVALAGLMLSGRRAVDDLRRDLTARMDRIDERLHAVEAGQAELRGRFDGIGGRFDGIGGRFDGIGGRFDGIEGRFDGVEGRFDGVEGQLAFLRDYITGRNTRPAAQPAAPAE